MLVVLSPNGSSTAGGSAAADNLTGSDGPSLVCVMRTTALSVLAATGGSSRCSGPAEPRRVSCPPRRGLGRVLPASVLDLEGSGMPDYGQLAEPLCSRLSESWACMLHRRARHGLMVRHDDVPLHDGLRTE